MGKTYVCPHCGEVYTAEVWEEDDFEEYECPLCQSGVNFEGNEQ